MNKLFPLLCAVALLAAQTPSVYAAEESKEGALEQPLFQVFLGVLELDDQTGKWDEISNDEVDVDFSSLPSGGMEGEYVYYQGWVHVGLNPGGSFAWKDDDTNFSGGYHQRNRRRTARRSRQFPATGRASPGRLCPRSTERPDHQLRGGRPYGDVRLRTSATMTSNLARLGGPSDMKTDSSDVNVGYYARAGIDFEIGNKQHLGSGPPLHVNRAGF